MSQSSQKKTRAMLAQSDEDGEKAFTCVEVEGTRSRRNSKKSGTEGSTHSDRAVYSAVCRAQMLRLVICNRLVNLGISKQQHLYLKTKNLI